MLAEVVSFQSGSAFQAISLGATYSSPVVVCTPESGALARALVTRVRNTSATSFEGAVVAADLAGGFVADVTVHCLVVEAGTYTLATHGAKLEAKKYASTRTDRKGSFVGQRRTYSNTYQAPVVVGQVMSANDPRWSTFWARGSSRGAPPSTSTLYAGKYVAEDTVITRADETVGYVVFEKGTGAIGGVAYRAGLSGNLVRGFDDGPTSLAISAPIRTTGAVLSAAAFDGGDGGWPVLFGPNAVAPTALSAVIEEDAISDLERSHLTAEQVAFVTLASTCECDDANPCTLDTCAAGVCGHASAPTGTLCDDGDACTTADVCDGSGTCAGTFACNVPKAELVAFTSGTDWTIVPFVKSYASPVVVCSLVTASGNPPLTARVRGVTGTQLEVAAVRVDAALGFVPAVLGRCLVTEEGVYSSVQHGITMEARRLTSTLTDRKGSFVGQPVAYSSSYSFPVIIGQVMSANDARFSTFWARGASQSVAPSATVAYVGKHVAEDPVTTRAPETVGYIVFEAGSSELDGIPLVAGVSGSSVGGMGNQPPYAVAYSAVPNPSAALVSSAGLAGPDGGWPVLFGPSPVSPSLSLAIEEDDLGDVERSHTLERVAYVVFGSNVNCAADSDGDGLSDCAETNTRIFLSPTDTGTDPGHPDTDGDGILDGAEVLGATGVDLPSMGADPLRRTIFVEMDWLADSTECGSSHDHRPPPAAIDASKSMFASAPLLNPDGSTGIDLIIDFGQGGTFAGGNLIGTDATIDGTPFASGDYLSYKAAHFSTTRSPWFHYVIVGHQITAFPNAGGIAELPGDDLAMATYCFGSVPSSVAAILTHELGHNLFLRHGGDEDCNYKPNYNSIMNYRYAFNGVDRDCDGLGDGISVLDYSRGQNVALIESSLDERVGICSQSIDWDFDGQIEALVSTDINAYVEESFECPATLETLTDFDDWAGIVLDWSVSPRALRMPPEIWP